MRNSSVTHMVGLLMSMASPTSLLINGPILHPGRIAHLKRTTGRRLWVQNQRRDGHVYGPDGWMVAARRRRQMAKA